MKTLVTAIQKGGQGKTFATCHLAFNFQERGLRIVVIDLDIQANATYTLGQYKTDLPASSLFSMEKDQLAAWAKEEAQQNRGLTLIGGDSGLADVGLSDVGGIENLPNFSMESMDIHEVADVIKQFSRTKAVMKLRDALEVLAPYYDVCLIDTPPSLGVVMTAAILSADYMLSPIEMEAYSLQGMQKMVSVIGNLRQQNPNLRFIGMVPNKVDARKPRHVTNLAALQQAYPQLILPFSIGARDSIAEALGEKMPVWKVKKTAARKATKEVRALADYVYTKMEIAE